MSFSRDMIIRYTFRGRRRGFSRVVARASMLGMVLGVASLITVLSVMNGFAGELRTRIRSLVPHARVVPTGGSIQSWQTVAENIE